MNPDRLRAALADRYAIERELGQGGMATVYLARDLKHDRLVALKLLRPVLSAAVGPERFLLEIRVTARLQHPHILALLDSGTLEYEPHLVLPYYVMPYVEGESLRDRLVRERQLPVEDAVRIGLEMVEALAYAHAQGVVHRDIKPENILLANRQAVLTDFGIARAISLAGGERLTATGLAVGTPPYMSPEQAAGDTVDARTDIYALGCALYEMLAGDPPFTGPSAQAVLAGHIARPVPDLRAVRAAVPERLERAITRALAKLPADRFASAEEFGRALAEPGRRPSRPQNRPIPLRRWPVVALLAVLLAAAAGVGFWLHSSGPWISPSASLIAVLPLSPSGADTALARLGRDLVFTLSAELDGLGGIRVVDALTVLAQAGQDGLYTAAEGATLARRLGAGSAVSGSLVREGANVRLDFVLLPTDRAGTPLARGSVTGVPDSIAALTDSAARILLGQIWARGSAPTPSLDVALKTGSVPALRAFLTGEGEMAAAQWDSAAASYRRAIEADPGFWLAYARYVYARNWSLEESPDTLLATLARHRRELPDRERLTTEAILLVAEDSIARSLDAAREVSERYPDSWLGRLMYADQLLHFGSLLGHPRAEARAGFERTVDLNPDLIPGWEHLELLALLDHDTALVGRSLQELERLGAGPALSADGFGNRLLEFHFLQAVERGDSTSVRLLSDSIARDPAPLAVPNGSFYSPFRYGFQAQQIAVSRRALEIWNAPARQAGQRRLIAFSWAAGGAWDSALVEMDRLVTRGIDSESAVRAYGLAVVGAWSGAVDPLDATARRGLALAAAGSDSGQRAEVAWLDGVAAYAKGDRRGLEQARAALRGWEGSRSAPLGCSLGAFAEALDGSTGNAGVAMARLEWEEAAVLAPGFARHPWAIAVDRLAAARWLAPAGDPDQAARLLTWVEGPFLLHASLPAGLTLTALTDLERARIEELRGHPAQARSLYREFLRRYDHAEARQRHLAEEAAAAVARLASAGE
jgi:serine/threonine protein kinase